MKVDYLDSNKEKSLLCFIKSILKKGTSHKNTAQYTEDFDNFKNKQKAYEVMLFLYVKYIYSESLFNTLYNEIKNKC